MQPVTSATESRTTPPLHPHKPVAEVTDRFVLVKEVIVLTGLSRSAMYRLIAESKFPMPVRLGVKRVAWILSEIRCWMEERIAARDAG